MQKDLIFHIWCAIGYFHVLYLMIKMYRHVKQGYEHHYWLGFWMYSISSLNNEGQQIRKKVLIASSVYLFIAFIIARFF